MATVSYIKIKKEGHLLQLGITEGEETSAYTVREQIYAEIGSPLRHEELEGWAYDREEDTYIRAKRKALSLLSYADNSERTLIAKLRRAGFSRDISEDVSHEMVGLGYINEDSQLGRLITVEVNERLHGPMKLLPRLCAKGYSAEDIKRVIRRLSESGDIDFSRSAQTLINRKLQDKDDEEARRYLLHKYGYKISD